MGTTLPVGACGVNRISIRRLLRGLGALVDAFHARPPDVRIHHFVRAIEGTLSPDVRREEKFVEAAMLFVREEPSTQLTLKEIYRLRNKVEHLGDYEAVLANTPVAARNDTAMRRARQAEMLAIHLYRKVFTVPGGYVELFSDDASVSFPRTC